MERFRQRRYEFGMQSKLNRLKNGHDDFFQIHARSTGHLQENTDHRYDFDQIQQNRSLHTRLLSLDKIS